MTTTSASLLLGLGGARARGAGASAREAERAGLVVELTAAQVVHKAAQLAAFDLEAAGGGGAKRLRSLDRTTVPESLDDRAGGAPAKRGAGRASAAPSPRAAPAPAPAPPAPAPASFASKRVPPFEAQCAALELHARKRMSSSGEICKVVVDGATVVVCATVTRDGAFDRPAAVSKACAAPRLSFTATYGECATHYAGVDEVAFGAAHVVSIRGAPSAVGFDIRAHTTDKLGPREGASKPGRCAVGVQKPGGGVYYFEIM